MSMTIDNLRVDHHVTVLQDFTDASGITMRTGETGVILGLSMDYRRMEIHVEIERVTGKADLRFPLRVTTGPRNGHMQEYFEVGEDVTAPRVFPILNNRAERKMIVPREEKAPETWRDSKWARMAQNMDGPDRLETMEEEMRVAFPHIGVAASIAELYAQRMREFQRAGNEPRAIAAFKLAVDWMGTYAGWATSGGEGEALSYERDKFHGALAREFGYDPTDDNA